MISLEQIESFYPEHLRVFKKNLLREYLQHKILEAIFSSAFGRKLAFMGGTALRIVFSNDRFSEDLDFDNRGLSENGFEKLTELVVTNLTRYGGRSHARHGLMLPGHCGMTLGTTGTIPPSGSG